MVTGKKWIGFARLLAGYLVQVVKCINFKKELDPRGPSGPLVLGPWSLGPLFIPTRPTRIICEATWLNYVCFSKES